MEPLPTSKSIRSADVLQITAHPPLRSSFRRTPQPNGPHFITRRSPALRSRPVIIGHRSQISPTPDHTAERRCWRAATYCFVAGGPPDPRAPAVAMFMLLPANTFTQVANMPSAKMGMSMIGMSSGLGFVAGGWNGSDSTIGTYSYDQTTNTFTSLRSVPTKRHGAAIALRACPAR